MSQEGLSNKSPGLFRNYISWAGAGLSVFGLGWTIFLALIDMWADRPNPYIGIFAYVLSPAVLFIGLLLIPAGMWFERRRRRTTAPGDILQYPSIDFNNARHRRVFGFFLAVSLLLIPLSAVGSYRAYELTESNSFCGQACHSVMNPEFTAYQSSPHARVNCVECHVGPGAESYFRAKFSGVRRAYAAIFETYHRPIPSAIDRLRPARMTCAHCHWPDKFFGSVLKTFTHFGTDENNTPRQIEMLVHVGGGSKEAGLTAGIHWHMNLSNEIQYIHTDDKYEVIPWVSLKDASGKVIEYIAEGSGLTREQIESMPKRRMDCMDCHNRSAHTFNPPDRALNSAFIAGRLDVTLPYLKQQAIEVLTKEYASTDEALVRIASDLYAFYKNNYPDVNSSKQAAIRRSVDEVRKIYSENFFPEMKVNWRSYPEQIGHYYSAGCFRCHDGQHKSRDGQVIRKDCAICHTVLSQTEGSAKIMSGSGKEFVHPVDMGDMTQMNCIDCHGGGGQ